MPVGVTLLLTAILLSLLEFGFTREFYIPLWQTIVDFKTWEFIGMVAFIITFGEVVARAGFTARLVKALSSYFSPRAISRAAPAIIGLLPMPGGAMVSAPIIAELASDEKYSPAAKTAANYWWRHIWEPVWPLYQSVILAAAILNASIWKVARMNLPISLSAIIVGIFFVSLPLEKKCGQKMGFWRFLRAMLFCLWPIIFIVLVSAGLNINLLFAVFFVFIILLVFKIADLKTIWDSFKTEFSPDIAILFIGSLGLMKVITMGHSAVALTARLQGWSIPADIVVFLLPFLVGLLTGLTSAYVGVGFPIVVSLFPLCGGPVSGTLLAFTGGLMGILASPVHLCLVLTKNYFNATFRGVYRILIPAITLCTILIFLFKYLFYSG